MLIEDGWIYGCDSAGQNIRTPSGDIKFRGWWRVWGSAPTEELAGTVPNLWAETGDAGWDRNGTTVSIELGPRDAPLATEQAETILAHLARNTLEHYAIATEFRR
jgi:hypothetical protein